MEHVTYMPKQVKKERDKQTLLKYLFVGFNFLAFILACILLGVSIYMAVDRNFMTIIIGNDLYAAAVYIVLACGAAMFFLAFLGCCGVVLEKSTFVFVYFICLCVVALLLFIGGILAIVFHTQIGDSVKETMSETLVNSYGVEFDKKANRDITDAWDKAQERLMCCAVNSSGWHLYRQSKWFQHFGARDDKALTYEDQDVRPYVPQSCCVKNKLWQYVSLEVCQKWRIGPPGAPVDGAINRAIYYTGCFDAGVLYLQENSTVLFALAIAISLLLIFGIVVSLLIWLSWRKTEKKKPPI